MPLALPSLTPPSPLAVHGHSLGAARLVGIDEDEVERAAATLRQQESHALRRGAEPQVDLAADARLVPIPPPRRAKVAIQLERHYLALLRQRRSERERRRAAKDADLEDPLGAHKLDQPAEEMRLRPRGLSLASARFAGFSRSLASSGLPIMRARGSRSTAAKSSWSGSLGRVPFSSRYGYSAGSAEASVGPPCRLAVWPRLRAA